jgi:two-component system, cell cycle response regulator DivK
MLATMLHILISAPTNGQPRSYMPPPKRRPAGLPPTILVVDDDADSRLIYSEYLRAQGWLTFTAADGRSALDKVAELAPDAIVLDLAMPRVDGWTVLKHLRESSWTADIPVVVVTASIVARDQAFQAGCDAFLLKPCPPETLLLQLRGLFRIRPNARFGQRLLEPRRPS